MSERASVRRPRTQLNVDVPPDLKARIEALAKERGCFQQRVVVDAIRALLARETGRDSRGRP